MRIRSDNDRHTLLLHDMHQEYTGDFGNHNSNFESTKPANSTIWGDCELFWDSYGVSHTLAELRGVTEDQGNTLALSVIRTMLPAEFIDREGGPDAVTGVWRLTGSIAFLEMKFLQLKEALDVDYVSGDDDAFDYWPNTMDMLWDFALDLDALTQTKLHTGQVHEVARKVFEGTINRRYYDDRPNTAEEIAEQRELFLQEWGLNYPDGENESWNSWYLKENQA